MAISSKRVLLPPEPTSGALLEAYCMHLEPRARRIPLLVWAQLFVDLASLAAKSLFNDWPSMRQWYRTDTNRAFINNGSALNIQRWACKYYPRREQVDATVGTCTHLSSSNPSTGLFPQQKITRTYPSTNADFRGHEEARSSQTNAGINSICAIGFTSRC